ncbi:MAG: CBS domain-containing protein [Candidatus Methanofastidiosia archaeon]
MTKILVSDIMKTNIPIMKASDSVNDAIKNMQKTNSNYTLVSNGGNPDGIVTEKDIVTRALSLGQKLNNIQISEIMTSPVITIETSANIVQASQLITESKIRRLIVTENDKIVGVVTSFDILALAPELFESRDDEAENPEGGFCEFCGNYFSSLNVVEGKFVCDSCKAQLLEE